MKEGRIVDVLKTFSNKEIVRLKKFINSPYFNENTKITALIQFISGFHPKFNDKKLSYEIAYKTVFKAKEYNEKQLWYLMGDAVKVIENFMAVERFYGEAAQLKMSMLQQIEHKNLNQLYTKVHKQVVKEIEANELKDSKHFYLQYRLSETEFKHFVSNEKRKFNPSMQKMANNLDRFYMGEKLKYAVEMLTQQNVFDWEYEVKMIDEILNFTETYPEDVSHQALIYSAIYNCITKAEDEKHFFSLKLLLEENSSLFSINEARQMYVHATNYCIRKFNKGNKPFLAELLELYKSMLEKELAFEDNTLTPWTFKNISGVALRVGDYEWNKSFLENYRNKLAKQYQKTGYYFNMANHQFYIGDFSKAQDYLMRVEFNDTYFNTDSKVLLLKIYYELEELTPLEALSDSFQVYIRRNKQTSDYMKKLYLNFGKFLKRLYSINPRDKKKVEHLRERVEATSPVGDKSWLLQKIDTILH